jgi:hypothetical protein
MWEFLTLKLKTRKPVPSRVSAVLWRKPENQPFGVFIINDKNPEVNLSKESSGSVR